MRRIGIGGNRMIETKVIEKFMEDNGLEPYDAFEMDGGFKRYSPLYFNEDLKLRSMYLDSKNVNASFSDLFLCRLLTDDFDLKISDKCCYKLKKHPIQRYEKESGRNISILGLRMGEGGQRANHEGCVVFDNNHELKKFKPLNPCSDDWMEWYIKERNIKLCKLYYQPYNFNRTGCKGCPYAIDLQDQLEIMDKYLPNERKQCELIWKPIYQEYRRIGYRLKRIEEKRLF